MYVESTVDDRCYVCKKSSLQALCKYLTTNPLCEFCGKDYKWRSPTFSHQGRVRKVEVPCDMYNDSVLLLGSVLTEFWDTLQSTMPMLGEHNMYMPYFASKHI